MKISIVIPLYNEKKHISQVLNALRKKRLNVIVVDDGSRTPAKKIIKDPAVTVLTHAVNLGKGAAMKTGAEYAFANGAEAVIFMDADGQHSVEDVDFFTEKFNTRKYDLVLGTRSLNIGSPLIRVIGNRVASLVINMLFGINISDPLCGFRGLTKQAYQKVKWESTGYSVESEILALAARHNLKYIQIPVKTIYHDKDKGVTILDSFAVLGDVIKWRISR